MLCVIGEVASPRLEGNSDTVGHNGTPRVLTTSGGITYDVRVGDRARGSGSRPKSTLFCGPKREAPLPRSTRLRGRDRWAAASWPRAASSATSTRCAPMAVPSCRPMSTRVRTGRGHPGSPLGWLGLRPAPAPASA
jgi:hypothetical protein